jgi:hypothetical protein
MRDVHIFMRLSAFVSMFVVAAALLAGCATVSTSVTLLDPTQKLPPSPHASILFEYPPQPYVKIALVEVTGRVGGTEAELLEEVRKRAAGLGADAAVRLEVTSVHQPPALVYDPLFADPFYWRSRYPYRAYYGYPPYAFPPYAFPPYASSQYRWVGGGDVQTLKAVAIRFTGDQTAPAQTQAAEPVPQR